MALVPKQLRRKPYTSGFCKAPDLVNPWHSFCKGEFENGSKAAKPTTVCTCKCHKK